MASGSVNEILDNIADVQDFRDSLYLEDLTIPEIDTIKKRPKMNVTESDFINQALTGGKLSRSNSSNQLTNSELQKVSFFGIFDHD